MSPFFSEKTLSVESDPVIFPRQVSFSHRGFETFVWMKLQVHSVAFHHFHNQLICENFHNYFNYLFSNNNEVYSTEHIQGDIKLEIKGFSWLRLGLQMWLHIWAWLVRSWCGFLWFTNTSGTKWQSCLNNWNPQFSKLLLPWWFPVSPHPTLTLLNWNLMTVEAIWVQWN